MKNQYIVRIPGGRFVSLPDEVRNMAYPVRCTHCHAIYDEGKVTVTDRYSDCSVWVSPCCRRTVDSRGRDTEPIRGRRV